MFTRTKRKTNGRTTGIVGAIAAAVATISGIRTLTSYIREKKNKKK